MYGILCIMEGELSTQLVLRDISTTNDVNMDSVLARVQFCTHVIRLLNILRILISLVRGVRCHTLQDTTLVVVTAVVHFINPESADSVSVSRSLCI